MSEWPTAPAAEPAWQPRSRVVGSWDSHVGLVACCPTPPEWGEETSCTPLAGCRIKLELHRAMTRGKFVSYLRVSTDKQGHSGLGIEAQRKAVTDYLNGGNWQLLREYVEIESGKRSDRPELLAALALAKATGATVVIAKLDRLARNVAFISNLMESGVEFVAADMPMANRLTVHVLAAVAEHEREMISHRTRVALTAAKARGTKLGNPNGARALQGRGNASAVAAVKSSADLHAARVLPVIEDLRAAGTVSLHAIAAELNARGILTARNGKWYPTSVRNLLGRTRK
jgi:DNA invertase Pin-like site-specific DNA recombinase